MTGTEAAVVGVMAVITFALRYSFFALRPGTTLPPWAGRLLAFVPVAVLSAIIVPMILTQNGPALELSWRNAWLAGAIATGVVVWRTERLLVGICAGFAVYYAWRWGVAG